MRISISDMRATRLIIDLDKIYRNIRYFKNISGKGTGMMAVVKADAYGHGSLEVSRIAVKAGVDMLGVATLDEAVYIRNHIKKIPIMLLCPLEKSQIYTALRKRFILTINDPPHAEWLIDILDKNSKLSANIHIKINTGMNRLGVSDNKDIERLLDIFMKHPQVRVKGAYSHFFAADNNAAKKTTRAQLTKFLECSKIIRKYYPSIILHMANTAGILSIKESALDMIRIGIGIYGYPPNLSRYPEIQPALGLKTRIIAIQSLKKGEQVSYGFNTRVKKKTRIAVLPIGYADGWKRVLSNKFRAILRGRVCKGIGNICMDMSMIDIKGIDGVRVGDEVVLIGRKDGKEIRVEDVAKKAGTIVYEVVSSFRDRMPRYYING